MATGQYTVLFLNPFILLSTEDTKIDFSAVDDHSCLSSLTDVPQDSELEPWTPAVITQSTMFTARIGPTGGKRGYSAITGYPSWGIAWWVNDLLIPEIYVERGQTYTFVVEGGEFGWICSVSG